MSLQILEKAADFLWGGPLMLLLLGTGILATIRLRFPQRHIPQTISRTLHTGGGETQNPFSALMLHLAATLGVGNITGVAAAIITGGPGAVLWCWLAGLAGIATAYAETRCALSFCSHTPSPMHALAGHGKPRIASIYALALAASGLFIGAMLPSSSITSSIAAPHTISAAALSILTALVILGGVSRISRACEHLVPFVLLIFTFGCLGLLVVHRAYIIEALCSILQSAFDFRAVAGGIFGSAAACAMRAGVSRGVFSNEAGMGTAAITIGTLKEGSAHERAMVSAAAVFWDTVVFCALTGISFVTAATALPELSAITDGATFSLAAFSVLPCGGFLLQLCMIVLGFCCIIGWSYVGERGFVYLCPGKEKLYCLLWCIAVFAGGFLQEKTIWVLSDLINTGVILPSIYSIFLFLFS